MLKKCQFGGHFTLFNWFLYCLVSTQYQYLFLQLGTVGTVSSLSIATQLH